MSPTSDQLGETGTWPIGEQDEPLRARFIGLGSSRSPYHNGHPPDGHAAPGAKCQACRWMEIRIFDDDDLFTIDYTGRSEIPGETQRRWHSVVADEDQLIDTLAGHGLRGRFFSRPARQAIETARRWLPEIWDAYQEHPGNQAAVLS